jgi:phosphate transport system substrate-binding protein
MAVSAEDPADEDNSYQPFAAWIATGDYPMTRDVYIITSDIHGGLPSGFMNFVGGDRGQRIILKSGMLPATRPLRLVQVNTKPIE